MNLIDTGTDSWSLKYEACEKAAREIMENLNIRDSESKNSQVYNAMSAKIRIRLKQFINEVNELKKELNVISITSTLTSEEKERRQRQIEGLLIKEVQMTEQFNCKKKNEDYSASYLKMRKELMKTKEKSSAVLVDEGTASWGEINDFNNQDSDLRTIDDMKNEQERLLKEQDEGLENLLKIVTAQTKIATSINNEVEHHNEILVDISEGMDRVDEKINRAEEMVKVIKKKDSIWGYWLVAFLLLIAILGVVFA